MTRPRFWLSWAWRDLRLRWPVVLATALVLAIGAGLYATLGAMEAWRTQSADASFEALRAHDVRVTLDPGIFAGAGDLSAAVAGSVPARAVEERLSIATQLEVRRQGPPLLVAGRLVGSGSGEVEVDRLAVRSGRGLAAADAGRPVTVIEDNFARAHGLEPVLDARIGGEPVEVVGRALAPEWFVVAREGAVWGAEGSFGVAFTTLRTAQRLARRPGQVNEIVVRLEPGADNVAAAGRIRNALARDLPDLRARVVPFEEEEAPRFLYRDAENDQRVFLVFAALILAGAALGTFNLISRVVDAQRREIGIGMALGAAPRLLALRPLLLGGQIALLGAAAGVGVALGTAELFKPLLEDMLPLPVIRTPFQTADFLTGAALAILIPLAAAALAVRRSVRMTPVEAIHAGFRAAKGAGLAGAIRGLPLPGRSIGRMPVRNVLRAPRRTAMTVAGLAAVIGVVVSIGGMLDSFGRAVDDARAEIAGDAPDRVTARLETFLPASGTQVTRAASAPAVGRAQPVLEVPASVRTSRGAVDVSLRVTGDRSLWRPTLVAGEQTGPDGLLLSRRAADELGVQPGERVELRHPARRGGAGLAAASSEATVTGVHGNPFRQAAVAGPRWAQRMGLAGLTNVLDVEPAPGRTPDETRRALAALPGVAAAEEAVAVSRTLDDALDDFGAALRIGWMFALVLAVLLAFNATTINTEERRREHATMFAFGLGSPSVLRTLVLENVLVGLAATVAGVLLGRLILEWVVGSLVRETFPDLGMQVVIGSTTLLVAAAAGLLALATAPLLAARRLRRMDVPSTLRVVE